MRSLEEITRAVTRLTAEVRVFILEEGKKFQSASIEKKGHNDLVSYVDKTAEEMLVNRLKEILPGAGFITEENTNNERGAVYDWIIDPLDGTTNFIHGMPCYCISIALAENGELVSGIVHELNFDECFYGWKNGGAFLNENAIRVSAVKKLADSLLATGFPYHDYSRMEMYMQIFDHCMRHSHGLRRLGSAAADLAYVACGRFEGFYEYGLNPWDVAAGALLVQEAGGVVTDFSGNNNFLFGAEMVATNRVIYNEFIDLVKSKMK
jgi:myo-inositol-1(or 4)-monophosphatase